jgi:hypothetical protein
MTTAETLERLNDAEFELLAVRSLRELDTDCQAVIHMGMNAQGKTIPGPLDGFCRVPGINPPRFVMIAATTTSLNKLTQKWLAPIGGQNTKPKTTKGKSGASKKTPAAPAEGDLTKAAKQAVSLRQEDATASFILYLAMNRALSPELEKAARHAGVSAGLEVRFLEQSQLRDFLDTQPVGQWLRQEHLGIDADQISLPLLKKLCEQNRDNYANDVAMFDDFVPTETKSTNTIIERLKVSSAHCHLLVGASGVGKSVSALGALRSHLASGGLGLWLSSDAVEVSLSLPDAVRAVLSALHPKLGREAGISAMDLAVGQGGLVLVVDDINRSRAPLQLVKKVLSWMRPASADKTSLQSAGHVHLVCPLWNSYWSSIGFDAESSKWIDVVRLTQFTRPETVALLQTAPRAFSAAEMNRYADALEDDPILVGLFVRMLRSQPEANPNELCQDAIGSFIRSSTSSMAVSQGNLAESYTSAIHDLARHMLRNRSFHPGWREVQRWLEQSASTLQRLEAIAAQGHVCQIRETADDHVLEFRHDRLLEFFVTQAIKSILDGPELDWRQAFDFFYVPFLGRCLARTEFEDKVLDRVEQNSPASLIVSLRFLRASSSGYTRKLVTRATTWLLKCRRSSAEMRHAVQLLRETWTPFTLEVTESRKDDLSLWEARLRCGDPYAGTLSLSHDFSPHSNYVWLEQLIEEADANHHGVLMDGTANMLVRATWNTAIMRGAFTLAGYLGDPELEPAIAACWARTPETEKNKVLLQALWAALRCSNDDPRGVLAQILQALLLLNDTEENTSRLSERDQLLQELGPAGRHGYSVPVLTFLSEIGNEPEFERIVTGLLERVDHPIAVRFMVMKLAWFSERARQAKGFNPFANTWRENWEKRRGGNPISAASLMEMRLIWEDTEQVDWVRSYALTCWAELTPDIASLKEHPERCPSDETSIWHRAKAGDQTVAREYVAYLNKDWHWLYVMPEIWSPYLLPVASQWLARMQEASFVSNGDRVNALARVIRDIPPIDGEALLVEHWGFLGVRKEFVQAALHVSSEQTLELVRQSLADWNHEVDPFDRIDRYFFTGFYKISPDDRLSLRQVEGLTPYFNRLSARMLGDLLNFCGKRGYFEFLRAHLLAESRSRLTDLQTPDFEESSLRRALRDWAPTSEEITAELGRIIGMEEKHWGIQIELLLKQFLKADQSLRVLFETLEAWLTKTPDRSHFRVSALAIRYWGERDDLKLLESCTFAQQPEAQELLADCRYDVRRRSLQ